MLKNLFRLVLLASLPASFSPLHAGTPAVDTTYAFLFELNMTKAIQSGLFDPDSDQVYVTFTEPIPELLLLESPNNIYESYITQGLDSGTTYHFRFRINDTVFETVNREAIAAPGTTVIQAWWNDEYLNTTTFLIDASGFPFYYMFNPETDVIQIKGDMNNWQPVNLQRIGSTLAYEITYHLDPAITYSYLFQINGDTLIEETLGGITRRFLPPDTVIVVPQYFNNLDTRMMAMTFRCNMNIQEALGNFNPATDYLDVAANFNNWGAWDLLYDPYEDGIYQVSMLFDTALIGGPPLEFKFRINGSWETAELQGLDPRSFVLLPYDSTGNPNHYDCWYDNVGPVVPMPPWVTDLFIQGQLWAKNVVTGSYLYHNISGIPEGDSQYKWYRTDSVGAPLIPIDSAWFINYTLDSIEDIGKYIVFEVTPVAAYGDSAMGQPARVYTPTPIGGVGIPELEKVQARYYPNPVSGFLTIESKEQGLTVELIDPKGIIIMTRTLPRGDKTTLQLDHLKSGFYFIRLSAPGKIPHTGKLVIQ
ncbi:MAG: T9SS type A sorting domain-containing protein [bacterium]